MFAALLLHERLTRWVLVPILVSLAGVALVTRPDLLFGDAASHMKLTGTAVALLGALLSALAYVAVREASKTEPPAGRHSGDPPIHLELRLAAGLAVAAPARGWG